VNDRRLLLGTLAIEQARVVVGDHVLTPGDVTAGFVVPDPLQVVLVKEDGEVAIDVPDVATGRRILEALRVAVEHRAVHFEGISRKTRIYRVLLVWLAALIAVGAFADLLHGLSLPLVATVFAAAMYLSYQFGRRGPAFDVGSDGVRIGRRFIPLSDIRRATANVTACSLGHPDCFDANVVLSTRYGEVAVPLPHGEAESRDHALAIAERVQQALSPNSPLSPGSSILDDAVDNVADWRARVKALAGRTADYRGEALDPREMTRALEDPRAPIQRRVGAAIALHASGRDDARERIRVCAEATIEPHLRVALEKIADGDADDDVIERALWPQKR
jgi:hypothetical protein